MLSTRINNRFSDAEMQIVRETDLPELLTHLGYQVRQIGRYHTTAEMDSLRIKERRTWFRYSQNIGGDAITFLQQFHGKNFPEAVEYLLNFQGKARDSPVKTMPFEKRDEPPKAFTLPPRNEDDRRVFAYLRKRGIAPQVIRQFMNSGLLYEDAIHHNCVFVGRDSIGQAKYAGLRGTYDRDGKGFRGDVTGSDKNVGFSIPHDPRLDEVRVFEAPIDLMSYLTLHRHTSNALALCGLYVIYETPQKPGQDQPEQGEPDTGKPHTENPDMDLPCPENRQQLNIDRFNTDTPSTERSHPIPSPSQRNRRTGQDEMRRRETYRELILDNICYDALSQSSGIDKSRLDELVELIIDTVCSKREMIRIAGDDHPADVVRSRFLKLNAEHIEYILDRMEENTTQIRNIKKYLLAALYNAPVTMDSYYSALVGHDLYGPGTRRPQ